MENKEIEILTRRLLFEKAPLRIKIDFNKVCSDDRFSNEEKDWTEWYLRYDGYVFVADKYFQDKEWFNVTNEICDNFGVVFPGFYVHKKFCKILSGY